MTDPPRILEAHSGADMGGQAPAGAKGANRRRSEQEDSEDRSQTDRR